MSSSTPAAMTEEQDTEVNPGNAATSIPAPVNFTVNAPSSLPSPPFIPVSGVPNFRDLGGYTCGPPPESQDTPTDPTKKYHVRPSFLYRCATLAQITPQGCETLTSTLDIHTLYDLRSDPETSRPNSVPTIPDLTRLWTPVYEAEDYSPAVLAKKYKWYTSADADPAHGYSVGFVNAYRDIATYGARPDGPYRKIFKHIRDTPEQKLIFHCTAGKDRTGVLGALILKLCGVTDDLVAWEYSTTEPGLGQWRIDIIERMMRGGMGSQGTMKREEAERICGSRAGNMRQWLTEVLEGEFGGVEGYLVNMCDFEKEDLDRIRRNLIVEGDGRGAVEIPGWVPYDGN